MGGSPACGGTCTSGAQFRGLVFFCLERPFMDASAFRLESVLCCFKVFIIFSLNALCFTRTQTLAVGVHSSVLATLGEGDMLGVVQAS